MKNQLYFHTLIAATLLSTLIFSCENIEDESRLAVSPHTSASRAASPYNVSPTVGGSWTRVFTEDFNNSASLDDWTRTHRYDYNSDRCFYDNSVPAIASYDGRQVLVLTATSSGGGMYKSGHIKSNYNFKPGTNEEYRVSAEIKLIAKDGSNWKGFAQTYGAWPAFWTVQESGWPTKGEIDIMEGYSYSTYKAPRFASNLFYGVATGENQLGRTAEREYAVSEGWHVYDEYWKNEGGNVTVTIMLDGAVKATYTNATNPTYLHLENFGPHNIILNLNVGSNSSGIFDNNLINLFSQTMMWVDYVTVDKRTL